MIEINLLPEELRPKEEELIIIQIRQALIFILPLVFGLLIIIHLFLGGSLLYKKLQYRSLNKKWAQLEPRRKMAEAWQDQGRMSSKQFEDIYRLIDQRITISDKMQVLTEALPNGIWFNNLSFKQKEFYLEGSVVSLKKDQMSLLNLFLSRLKEDSSFFKDFVRLELGRMRMRRIGGFSVMDFVMEGNLK